MHRCFTGTKIAGITTRLFAMRPYTKTPADLNEERQITILKGKLFLVDHGNFILLTSPIVFKPGVIVTMDGMINMPGGKTRMLSEGEYVSTFST